MSNANIKATIAILDNAIAHLWGGDISSRLVYNTSPEYMCHAVEFATTEVLFGHREGYVCDRAKNAAFHEIITPIKEAIMDAIPGHSTADGYCRDVKGYSTRDYKAVQEFRKNVLTEIRAKYAAMLRLTSPVKGSELARAAIDHLFMPGRPNNKDLDRSRFSCYALTYAADVFNKEGRDTDKARAAVDERMAEIMGVAQSRVGFVAYDALVGRLLGEGFVEAMGGSWMQQRRQDMLERIANQLEKEGN